MKFQNFTFILTFIIISLTSCVSTKSTRYFSDIKDTSYIQSTTIQEPILKNNDLLKITIYADDPIAVAPFSSTISNNISTKFEYPLQPQQSYNQSSAQQIFLIKPNGSITFPLLGDVKIAGLTKFAATDTIKNRLTPYIKNPIVSILYCNYKVTILGEVNNPGTYTTENEHISILEALGKAGDITPYGKRNNILLIREDEKGGKQFIRIDLTKNNIFSSPYFYLQPNDVLYIEPNSQKTTIANSKNVPIYLGSISALASIATTIIALLNMK